MADLYDFDYDIRGLEAVILDGRGNVFRARELPEVKSPTAFLKRLEKEAAAFGDLCRVLGNVPRACSACGRESWNDDDFHATTVDRLFCKECIPSDEKTYSLAIVLHFERMKKQLSANQERLRSCISAPVRKE